VLGRDRSYVVENHSDSTKTFSETDIINMLECLLCLVGVFFNRESAYLWLQTVLLFSPTCSVIRMRQSSYIGFSRKNEKKLARSFKFTFHYIDDVISLNNSRFVDCVDHIYPIELEIKDTTETDMSASYLDLYLNLEIDS